MKKILLLALAFMAPIYCIDSEQAKKDKIELQVLKKQMINYLQEFNAIIDNFDQFCKYYDIFNTSPSIMDQYFGNDGVQIFLKDISSSVCSLMIDEQKSLEEAVWIYLKKTKDKQDFRLLFENIVKKYFQSRDLPKIHYNNYNTIKLYLFEFTGRAYIKYNGIIQDYLAVFVGKIIVIHILEEIEEAAL